MQKTVYKCDHCDQEMGDKKHISLRFGANSGIALPPHTPMKGGQMAPMWVTEPSLSGKFVHFCDEICIKLYFMGLFGRSKAIIKRAK